VLHSTKTRTRQPGRRLGSSNATTIGAGVAFDEDSKRLVLAGEIARKPVDDGLAVGDDGKRDAAIEPLQPCHLGLAENVVGDQHILDPVAALDHCFGFGHLLAGDANGAGLKLKLGHLRQLVRLDVRAHANAMFIGIGLEALDIALGNFEVDENGRRFDRQGHRGHFLFSRGTTCDERFSQEGKGVAKAIPVVARRHPQSFASDRPVSGSKR